MKNILSKVIASSMALTLVLASAVTTTSSIKTEEIPVKAPAAVQEVKSEEKEVKEDGILAAIEAKIKEEAATKIKKAETPTVEIAKTAAAAAITAPKSESKTETKAAPEIKVAPAAPVVEGTIVEAEAPVVEATVVEAEVPVVEAEPTIEWNISATEFDNVSMSFYADSVSPASQVNIDTQSGIVRIKGEGAMEENVYRHFMSTEKFLKSVKALFEETYGVEVDLVYDKNITDVIELDYNIGYYAHDTGERLYITGDMCNKLNPADFIEFSPTEIIIDEGITNVSDYAFLCCEAVETIVLPSTIETIGEYAFEYCAGLKKIVIPETAEIKEYAFLYCKNLTEVQLVGEDYYNGIMAQSAEGDTTVKSLTPEEIHALVYEW